MRFLFLLLFTTNLTAQCETDRTGRAYLGLPSFFSLYFSGQCVERNMGDTTICVKFPPQSVGQVAGFSYSSPSGQPAFVTAVNQYSTDCELIEQSPLIYPSTDTTIVCYTIQAELIDNFCPYAILSPGLSVEFCGLQAEYEQNFIRLHFATCSNAGTLRYEVIISSDLMNWRTIYALQPEQTNSSDLTDYNLTIPYNVGGLQYVAVREVDYEGRTTVSDIAVLIVPEVVRSGVGFDILGRSVSNSNYLYIVKPTR
jgi:hypothetical protein